MKKKQSNPHNSPAPPTDDSTQTSPVTSSSPAEQADTNARPFFPMPGQENAEPPFGMNLPHPPLAAANELNTLRQQLTDTSTKLSKTQQLLADSETRLTTKERQLTAAKAEVQQLTSRKAPMELKGFYPAGFWGMLGLEVMTVAALIRMYRIGYKTMTPGGHKLSDFTVSPQPITRDTEQASSMGNVTPAPEASLPSPATRVQVTIPPVSEQVFSKPAELEVTQSFPTPASLSPNLLPVIIPLEIQPLEPPLQNTVPGEDMPGIKPVPSISEEEDWRLSADFTDEEAHQAVQNARIDYSAPLVPSRYSLKARRFQHEGSTDHSFQDASYIHPDLQRIAVADGVGTSIYQKQWANILTQAFVQAPPTPLQHIFPSEATPEDIPPNFIDWIEGLRAEWQQWVAPHVEQWQGDLMRYHVALRLYSKIGASATFMGLQFYPCATAEGPLRCVVIAIGDTCLLRYNRNTYELLEQFPPCDFGYTPQQISTRLPVDISAITCADFEFMPDQVWLVATDAMAEWLIKEADVAQVIQHLSDEATFSNNRVFGEWATDQKNKTHLKSDDFTLCLLSLQAHE